MKCDIGNITITHLIGVVPSNVSYFDDEIENYSHDRESSVKLKKVMGYNQHRVVQAATTVSDMAECAFHSLLDSGFERNSVDGIVVVTQTPDFQIPSTSSVLHGLFKLRDSCYCVDINDGCTGFIKGLFEASSLMRNSDIRRILLVTGDVLSRKVSIKDRNSYPLVGDAVTMCVIDFDDTTDAKQPLELLFDGQGALTLNIPAGGTKLMCSEQTRLEIPDDEGNVRSLENLVMQGRDVFTFTQTTVTSFLADFRSRCCVDLPAMYFFHQANLFIIDRMRKALKVAQEQLPTEVISNFGNSSSATIPMAILLAHKEKSELMKDQAVMIAGFGVGLSWGAAIIYLRNLEFCKLIEGDF